MGLPDVAARAGRNFGNINAPLQDI